MQRTDGIVERRLQTSDWQYRPTTATAVWFTFPATILTMDTSMEPSRFFVATAVLAAAAYSVAAGAAEKRPSPKKVQPVKILNTWNGKIADAALRKHAPTDEFLLGQNEWAKLWRAWRGQEKLPEVDFQKQMILVFTADGPNSVGCEPRLDAQGNVQAEAMSTMIGGPGFGYLIQCISREGVRSVNGKPLPGEKIPAKKPRPKTPRREPGASPGAVPGSPGVSPAGEPAVAPAGERGVVATSSSSEPQPPPREQLDKLVPKRNVFDRSGWKKPLVLRSQEEAANHLDAEELAKLRKQVDFAKQFVLLFAWRGSGQDRLDAAVAESYPEQIFFSYAPGSTRDLQEHVRVFALRSNVKWSVKSGQEALAQPPPGANEGRFPGSKPPRPPRIVTHIPSAAGGQQGTKGDILLFVTHTQHSRREMTTNH